MVVYWVDGRKQYEGDDHGDGTIERPYDNLDLALAAVENSSFPSEVVVVPSSSSFWERVTQNNAINTKEARERVARNYRDGLEIIRKRDAG